MVLKRTDLTTSHVRLIRDNCHKSDAELARMTGISAVGVWKIRKRYGLPAPTERYKSLRTPPMLVRFVERNISWSNRKLMDETGLSYSTIHKLKKQIQNGNSNQRQSSRSASDH